MEIVGYLRTSLIEWPGKIVSVAFVPGCNWRCPFCHNSALVDWQKIAKLPRFPGKRVLADLEERKRWIDGVVVTGGEPTLQPDLGRFLSACQQLGLATKVETNGSQPGVLRDLIKRKLVDYFSLDFKTSLDAQYRKAVGIKDFDFKVIINSLRLLLTSGVSFGLQTTIVPGIHDQKTLIKMAQQLATLVGRRKVDWFWQNFQPRHCLDPRFEKKKPYLKEELEAFFLQVRTYYPQVHPPP